MAQKTLHCDNMTGAPECVRPVTMVDEKGYIYCTECGLTRRWAGTRCRKLRAHELRRLASGACLKEY